MGFYEHAGGIQIWNNLLTVALEKPQGGSDNGAVAFFDISDPRNPRHLVTDPLDIDRDLGEVALVGQPDGSLLVAVCGWDDSAHIRFYSTTEAALRHPPANRCVCTVLDQCNCTELDWLEALYWQTGVDSMQSLNFVRDSNGGLYLVGAFNTAGGLIGRDYVQLWQVSTEDSQYTLRFVDDKRLYASDAHSGT